MFIVEKLEWEEGYYTILGYEMKLDPDFAQPLLYILESHLSTFWKINCIIIGLLASHSLSN